MNTVIKEKKDKKGGKKMIKIINFISPPFLIHFKNFSFKISKEP
jgi:hypothetical protein